MYFFLVRKLTAAAITLMLLIYLMIHSASPKIIFVPFLFCAIASVGKNAALLLGWKKGGFFDKFALICDRMFKIGFFLFWFGFLIVGDYILIRDRNYGTALFTLPFWLSGIFFMKRKFSGKDK